MKNVFFEKQKGNLSLRKIIETAKFKRYIKI